MKNKNKQQSMYNEKLTIIIELTLKINNQREQQEYVKVTN